ncbi:hypothetical protein EDC94DRAFT_99774 [Helicostylum pulchrum]|nr:hypothetical protein EDC94DRAFT_99774 [Helicostylum pulchrum]
MSNTSYLAYSMIMSLELFFLNSEGVLISCLIRPRVSILLSFCVQPESTAISLSNTSVCNASLFLLFFLFGHERT